MSSSTTRKLLKCNICHETFSNKFKVIQHTWCKHERNIDTAKCEVCASTFTAIPELLKHTKSVMKLQKLSTDVILVNEMILQGQMH